MFYSPLLKISKEFYVAGIIIIIPILEIIFSNIIPKETKALKILGKPRVGTQNSLAVPRLLACFWSGKVRKCVRRKAIKGINGKIKF